MFLRVLRDIRYLARQGMSFRSNRDDDGNFIQLLHLQGVENPDIETWMKKKTNKYTSHDIQNECVQLLALQIVREMSCNIRDSGCYIHSWLTSVPISMYPTRNNSLFVFDGLELIFKTTKTLLACMKWVALMPAHSFMLSRILCFAWDSAFHNAEVSAMMGLPIIMCGSKSGVSTQIQLEEKRAVYSHCHLILLLEAQ